MEERYYLIGTAGHVDHGKTELIRALTGIETDRLKEEKKRGISIELGFAHLGLPSGREVGIVDVPGHERFVRQMLAGASGMDIVLLVIAADEGIMPQTHEHLNILTLLSIPRGIVVISKIDLVDDEWQELVEEEIKEKLKGTPFDNAPICPVSSVTKEGISNLAETIDRMLDDAESKKSSGPVRMPLDRVFSLQGIGTVVTGTLHSGIVEAGQELAIEPSHILTRVRSIQVHNKKVTKAYAGQRVAINLTGVEVSEVKKGENLVTPNAFSVGNILDIKIQNLPLIEKPIVQRQRVRFHLGTAEILGRVHLLEHEELGAEQEGYAQILLESPVLIANGDRFVLRFYSPAETIGGGKILGVAKTKQKRFKEDVLEKMRMKDKGNPLELLEKGLEDPKNISELESEYHMSSSELEELLRELNTLGRLEEWNVEGEKIYWAKWAAEQWKSKLINTIKAYEKEFPLRGGIGREELRAKSGMAWRPKRWQIILEEGAKRGLYSVKGSRVRTVEGADFNPDIRKKIECLRVSWNNAGLIPPDFKTASVNCGISEEEASEFIFYFVEEGEWVLIGGSYFTTGELEKAKKDLVEFLKKNGEATIADVRDLWGISRKYSVPLLEYFDQIRVTRRVGDKRISF